MGTPADIQAAIAAEGAGKQPYPDWLIPALGGVGGFLLAGPAGAMTGAGLGLQYNTAQTQYAQASANFDLQRENYEWLKWAQQHTWEREDSAVQRRVADLRAAGLSPTLAAGSAATTGNPVRLEAPQRDLKGLSGLQILSQNMPELFFRVKSMEQALMQQRADISRTDAQTSLINAQRNNLSTMTPLRAEAQELSNKFSASTMQSRVDYLAAHASAEQLRDDLIHTDIELKKIVGDKYKREIQTMIDRVLLERKRVDIMDQHFRAQFGGLDDQKKRSALELELKNQALEYLKTRVARGGIGVLGDSVDVLKSVMELFQLNQFAP